jgi:malate dehydrogenase (oxaloacetate-decarboxylating)(NADP+)
VRAAHILAEDGYCSPILVGDPARIAALQKEQGLIPEQVRVFDPHGEAERDAMAQYAEEFWRLRQRKGVRRDAVRQMLGDTNRIGALMVRLGHADGLVTGKTKPMSTTLRPIIRIVKPREGVKRVAGVHIAVLRDRWLFFTDTTVNNRPSREDLVEIASLSVELARDLQEEPRVAFLSFANFGNVDNDESPREVASAAALFRERFPDVASDGEMAADTALNPRRAAAFPFSAIKGDANILVFPDIGSANIGFKLVRELAQGASVVGPILLGMAKPVNVVDQGATADEIVTVATITASAIDNQPG